MTSKPYAFVLDSEGRKLAPMDANKAGYFIRKGKATLLCKFPLVIQLTYEVIPTEPTTVIVGIDSGSKETGIALVQECETKAKPLFKGVIYHRNDIKKKLEVRKAYRRNRRKEKRYRPKRFHNRASSRRNNRVAPSIKNKKDEIIRVLLRLSKYTNISKVVLEDVAIDIRALQEGRKLYHWEYQKSNRLDENLRKATLMRDNFTCVLCNAKKVRLEAHHVIPKRNSGSDTITNLVTLCSSCHEKVTGKEEAYLAYFQSLTQGKELRLSHAQHVMQGKTYLRTKLSELFPVELTTGASTSNVRIDRQIPKSHENDALVVTGLPVLANQLDITNFSITPLRRKCQGDVKSEVNGIKLRDFVLYKRRKQKAVPCVVIAILQSGKHLGKIKLADLGGNQYGPVSANSLQFVWRFSGMRFAQ